MAIGCAKHPEQELGLDYTVVRYQGGARTMLAPPELKKMGIRNLVWVSGFRAVVALISKDGF